MVTITSVSPFRSLLCVHLDNGKDLYLTKAAWQRSGFTEGDMLEEEALKEFVQLVQYRPALHYAVSLLARRSYSKAEIRHKLTDRKYLSDVTDLVLCKLEKEKLLDDREFCSQWISYRLSCNYGSQRIIRELKQKGVPENIIREELETLDPSSESQQAFQLALKAWSRIKPGESLWKARQKVCASLVRKGFSWETVKNACEQAQQSFGK